MKKENKKSIKEIEQFFLNSKHDPAEIKQLFQDLINNNTEENKIAEELLAVIQKIMLPEFTNLIKLLGNMQKVDPKKTKETIDEAERHLKVTILHSFWEILS